MTILNDILDDGIDPRYAAAGEVLVKIAEAEDFDLDDLSDEDVASLLTEIVESDEGGDDEGYGGGDEGYEGDVAEAGGGYEGGEEKAAGVVTHAMIGRELSKIASSEGVDLSSLPQAEYDSLYNEVANVMTQPGYFQKQAAAREKLAEADAIGRAMAHSFDDELRKMASDGMDKIALSRKTKLLAKLERGKRGLSSGYGKVRSALQSAGAKAKDMEGRASTAVGRTLRGGQKKERARILDSVKSVDRKNRGTALRLSKADEAYSNKSLGRKALGGAAGAATLAGGGAAYKMSFDQDVIETARAILAESGIDPDTGVKVAHDYNGAVAEAAVALLEEKGYTFG